MADNVSLMLYVHEWTILHTAYIAPLVELQLQNTNPSGPLRRRGVRRLKQASEERMQDPCGPLHCSWSGTPGAASQHVGTAPPSLLPYQVCRGKCNRCTRHRTLPAGCIGSGATGAAAAADTQAAVSHCTSPTRLCVTRLSQPARPGHTRGFQPQTPCQLPSPHDRVST